MFLMLVVFLIVIYSYRWEDRHGMNNSTPQSKTINLQLSVRRWVPRNYAFLLFTLTTVFLITCKFRVPDGRTQITRKPQLTQFFPNLLNPTLFYGTKGGLCLKWYSVYCGIICFKLFVMKRTCFSITDDQ